MKSIKSWLSFLVNHAFIFGGIAAWQLADSQTGHNVAFFLIWLNIVLSIIATMASATEPTTPHSALRIAAGRLTTIVLVLILAGLGNFVTASFYVFGALCHEIWRRKFDVDGNPLPTAQD